MGKGGKQDQSQQTSTNVVTENHNLQDNKLGLAGSDGNSISTSENRSSNMQTGYAGNAGSITVTDNSDQAFHDAALTSMAAIKANEELGRSAITNAVAAANHAVTGMGDVANSSVFSMGMLSRDVANGSGLVSRDVANHSVTNMGDLSRDVANHSVSSMGTVARDTTLAAVDLSQATIEGYNALSKTAFAFGTNNAAVTERATMGALNFADNFSRSDDVRTSETMVKWGAGAAAAIALALIAKG